MRVNEAETLSEQPENLGLFAHADFFLPVIKLFKTEINLEQKPIVTKFELLLGNFGQLFVVFSF